MFTRSHYRHILVPPLLSSKIFISPLGRCPFPAPTGRNAKAQGIALGMFRKISAKPCRGIAYQSRVHPWESAWKTNLECGQEV